MKSIIVIFLITGICLVFIFPVAARDFNEPHNVADPLATEIDEPFALCPSGYGEFVYINHTFISSAEDIFYFSVLGSFTAFNLYNFFALGGYYSCYNLIGPHTAGDPIINIAHWWMNGIEFEYGLTAAFNILDFHLVMEYARTSQHNLRSMFSEVSTDSLKLGIVFPELNFGNLSFLVFLRGRFVDLFDFWESALPEPRIEWIFTPYTQAVYRLNPYISLFLRANLDWNLLCNGGMDTVFYIESGVLLGKFSSRMEIFLEYFQSPDTEELRFEPAPATLLGVGFRSYVGK